MIRRQGAREEASRILPQIQGLEAMSVGIHLSL